LRRILLRRLFADERSRYMVRIETREGFADQSVLVGTIQTMRILGGATVFLIKPLRFFPG